MNVVKFDIGKKLFYGDVEYVVKGYPALDEVLLKSTEPPHKEKIVKVSELVKEPNNAKEAPVDYLEIDEKEYEKALERFHVIEPLLKMQKRTADAVKEVAKTHKKGLATIYRWLETYETYGTVSSLAPRHKNSGGKGRGRIDPSAEAIVTSVVEDLYLNKQQYPFSTIYEEIEKKCRLVNVAKPSRNTVRSRIESLNPKLIAKHRKGVSVRDTRGMPGRFPDVKMPLDIIQIDHTKVDVMLVDEVNRENIGRPNITVAIDVYSRMIYGFYISLDPINFFSAGQCLLSAILPKEDFLKHTGINGEWPLYGLPRKVHMDNAKEFRSKALQKFCQEYRIQDIYRPVARPEFGGAIERVIQTSMKQTHKLPGSTFSNVTDKGTYDSEKEATMTIDELERWYTDFVVNIYHKTVHTSLGMTPEEKFYQGLYGVGEGTIPFLPTVPADTVNLRLSLLPVMERSVQKNGITIDYITYFSETLRKWIIPANYKKLNKKLHSTKLLCRRDPRDISKIYVYDPDVEDYITVPYSDIRKPAINLKELRLAINEAKKEVTGRGIEMHDVFSANDRLQGYVEQSKKEKLSARRQKSSKKRQEKSIEYEEKILSKPPAAVKPQATKLNLETEDEDDEGFEYYPVDE
jgi:putative transposase